MFSRQQTSSAAAAILSLTLLATSASADNNNNISTNTGEPKNSGWSLQMDNDLFTPKKQDRDYTGGLAVTFAGTRAQNWPISLDPALSQINRWLAINDEENSLTLHSLQLGLAAFAPEDLTRADVNRDDRPYASLVFLANSRVNLQDDGQTAIQSTLTVGVLGTRIAENLQKQIHALTESEPPKGWQHQISNGGEPTLRYTYAHQRLWLVNDGEHHLEVKYSNEGSIGFLTEANSAISARWGRINTPWWSFAPDRAEYFSQPTTGLLNNSATGSSEFYVWAGAKIRARAYNAFLQGQFRDSELTYSSREVRPVLGEAWLGVTKQISPHSRLSWVWRYQSSELRSGNGDRNLLWGSILINRDF
ncbi:MAG: lipid A deacylase LpxR family protein [Agitococcus sp.]|nr:lipid A deacylase LpxR family protein [Agitococcus sp.]